MRVLKGKSVCGGIAFGRATFYRKNETKVIRRRVEDSEKECERYIDARDKAIVDLEVLYYKATREIGEAEAQIFSIHQMMLSDADYNDSVLSIIKKQQLNAETAVLITAETFSKMFAEMDDVYMQARAADVQDISDRVIQILSGKGDDKPQESEAKVIIFAKDLSPSETLQMDKTKIEAFVTEKGSSASHTAILARAMDIPAIIGVNTEETERLDGEYVAVNGYTGEIFVEPDEDTLRVLLDSQRQRERQNELLKELKDKPSVTLDGKRIKLYANVGSASDLGQVIVNDGEGVGLFRSEFLYMERDDFPDEEVQFEAYRKIAQGMSPKPVIIRTLDIGADKNLGYFGLNKEENPAMGMRAIRICLKNQEIFKTQLRAILRASAFGNVMIMLPMIVSVDEVRRAKEIIEEVKKDLTVSRIAFDERVPVGIMIETPAAAMISDLLAKEADFFSIGTNDLSQYVLAMDRQNDEVAEMMDTKHEAIFRMIEMTCKNGHRHGIWTGICGELASDEEIIPRLLRLGVDELSVSPAKILATRKIIRENYAK